MSGKMIQFPSNAHQTPGYLAIPEGNGPFSAVVAIQEWWGLVGHIKDVADRFAAEGFVTLAPDLYHGQIAEEPNEARKLAMALDRNSAIKEISAAVEYLRSIDQVRNSKVGTVGWCMGGGLALSAAANGADVNAVVCFYGRPLEVHDTAKLTSPVLGLYGDKDGGNPLSVVQDFDKDLERHNVPHHIHVYAGAEHAFFNDERPAYHPEAAADAWQRTLAWFRQYLT
jgi:carboxymethylenebutenolidase